MSRKIFFGFFGFAWATGLIGCRPVSTADTQNTKLAPTAQDWNLSAGTVVQLQVANETYFKSSLEMVRISDGKGGLKLNPNYNAKKCGLRKGTVLSFKFETTLNTNPKYAIGEVVSIQNEKSNTFDAVDNYCTSKSQGFIFKSDFTFAKSNGVDNQTAIQPDVKDSAPKIPDTPEKDDRVSEITGSSTDQNGVNRGGVIYPLEDSFGTYYARTKVTTPNDSYVLNQTKRVHELKKTGQLGATFLNLKNAVVYAKDGRSRFPANLHNHIYSIPGFEAKNFQNWEGSTDTYTLVPTTFNFANGTWCEQITFSGAIQRQDRGVGTTCPVPKDEDGLSWLWIKCSDLAALSSLRCGTVSPGKFISK